MSRTIVVDSNIWKVYPAGRVTVYGKDEFGLVFELGTGRERKRRFTRYSSRGSQSTDAALAELTERQLLELFRQSQPLGHRRRARTAHHDPFAAHPGKLRLIQWTHSKSMRGVTPMAKVLCVLYDDPVDGYPKYYARNDIPKIERYPGGQTVPTPQQIDFKPGELLGSVSGELGPRKFLEAQGHALVVTAEKDGANPVFERELPDAEIVISQPFWPAYLTQERIAKAPS